MINIVLDILGFRHLPLHDAQLSPHLYSTLFVQISIRDIN